MSTMPLYNTEAMRNEPHSKQQREESMTETNIEAPIGGRFPNLQKAKWVIFSYIAIFGGALASIELGGEFHEYDSMGIIMLNSYAFSIGVCGVGVLFAGLVIQGLLKRIEALESKVKELAGG